MVSAIQDCQPRLPIILFQSGPNFYLFSHIRIIEYRDMNRKYYTA